MEVQGASLVVGVVEVDTIGILFRTPDQEVLELMDAW